jgi:hypothetical protein
MGEMFCSILAVRDYLMRVPATLLFPLFGRLASGRTLVFVQRIVNWIILKLTHHNQWSGSFDFLLVLLRFENSLNPLIFCGCHHHRFNAE